MVKTLAVGCIRTVASQSLEQLGSLGSCIASFEKGLTSAYLNEGVCLHAGSLGEGQWIEHNYGSREVA